MESIISHEDLALLNEKNGLKKLISNKNCSLGKIIKELKYEEELRDLQIELVKLQRWIQEEEKRVLIIFEGRDAAGKGGAILRFTQYLSPRAMRVVALPKPTEIEKGQWYFQRYVNQLPNPGEMVFFDRSWYNRAVIEPVMGFCTEKQYQDYMRQVPDFEHMLHEDGLIMFKFWFSVTKEEQAERFAERKTNPLKQWKLSPVDEKAQEVWDLVGHYKEEMFIKTHTAYSPWLIIQANNKRKARLEVIRHVLSEIEYEGKEKAKVALKPDPNIVVRYYRSSNNLG